MVISDKTRFPGEIIKGKDFPHDRNTSGMLFYNDEGTENGGLIFGGQKNSDGSVSSYGHLSFDFLATHPRGTPRLMMARAADGSTSLALKDQQGNTRILMQVGPDGAPVVQLLDANGRIISQLPH